MTRQRHTVRGLPFSLVCLLLAVGVQAGCGGNDGLERYDLTGNVTLDGKPIPVGELLFAPDTSQGNSGPGTVAKIKGGRYKTPPGRGVVGGPYRVTVTGFDGRKPTRGNADTHPLGNVMVEAHTLDLDLPKQDGTVDIEIPKSASTNK